MNEPTPPKTFTPPTPQDYLKREAQSLADGFANIATMDFSKARHRRIVMENLRILAGKIPELAVMVAFELERTQSDPIQPEEFDG